MSSAIDHNAGGFLQPLPASGLLSPPASSIASSTASSTLPSPRRSPLRAGSTKEMAFRNYVDKHVNQIQRKYAMKFSGEDDNADDMGGGIAGLGLPAVRHVGGAAHGAELGYDTFREVAKDIEKVVEVVWVSGTPGLQTPYLLTLALLVVSYLPSFPAAPRTMFRLLDKLDTAFASLLLGKDLDTGDSLPGFANRRGLSGTEKVRIKSLVERTRVAVVEVMNKGEYEEDVEEDGETGEEDEDDNGMADIDYDASTDYAMEVAKVYDKTLVELGDTLDGAAIGLR